MYSPVTGKKAKTVDSFPVDLIIKGYRQQHGIDVSSYFEGMIELPVYECSDTKLRFFYPAHLAGDGFFYSALENEPGYYSEWKPEYDEAFNIIPPASKVLDIGCGKGAFLEKIKNEKGCNVMGLEYNPSAFQKLQTKNIPASMENIEQHSVDNIEVYDVVTFFQVLEHIASVKNFLGSAVRVLKKNGLMIVGVPNNSPYLLKHDKYNWLNLPPHHMGWWNYESLNNLQHFFPVTTEVIKPSPFRHYNWYLDSLESNAKISNPGRLPWLKLTRPFRKQWIQIVKNKLPGPFILAVYKKNKI